MKSRDRQTRKNVLWRGQTPGGRISFKVPHQRIIFEVYKLGQIRTAILVNFHWFGEDLRSDTSVRARASRLLSEDYSLPVLFGEVDQWVLGSMQTVSNFISEAWVGLISSLSATPPVISNRGNASELSSD